jgi:hypothetical protein
MPAARLDAQDYPLLAQSPINEGVCMVVKCYLSSAYGTASRPT